MKKRRIGYIAVIACCSVLNTTSAFASEEMCNQELAQKVAVEEEISPYAEETYIKNLTTKWSNLLANTVSFINDHHYLTIVNHAHNPGAIEVRGFASSNGLEIQEPIVIEPGETRKINFKVSYRVQVRAVDTSGSYRIYTSW